MNDLQIETFLRHAPKITPPAGLLARLQSDITLPRPRVNGASVAPWFKRWIPAFSFGLFVLGCLVALAIQTSELAILRQQNQILRETAAVEPPDATDPSAVAQTLETLRRDHTELQNLRAEIEGLRQLLAAMPELQAQTEALREQLQSQRAAALTNSNDPFAAATEEANSIQCISHMKQIGLAVRMWANDHKDWFPPDFLTASNEMNTPKILVCPSEKGDALREFRWDRFDPAQSSYDYYGAGLDETDPEVVVTRCRIHGHIGLCDGSVTSSKINRFRLVLKDGKWKAIPR